MREAILRAMRELVVENTADPSLDEIAAAVGVTTRTVQDYFTSSAAIEVALIAHLDPQVRAGRAAWRG